MGGPQESVLDNAHESALESVVAAALRGRRVVLAVSGGRDSMSLLHAAAARARDSIACVATFDHGTGAHATQALERVRRVAAELDVEMVDARATVVGRTEAEWREQRWAFLRRLARARGAHVATAHTRDDQLETVLMRVMRGSGARGIAALAARAPRDDTRAPTIVRPMLQLSRAQVAHYAERTNIPWVEDPGNARRDHLRNRIRHDLLPALLRASPSLGAELLALADRAARLRADVDDFVDRELVPALKHGTISIAHELLLRYDAKELALLWPVLAARAGATLDRRGTERLVAFTKRERRGTRIQLSGGFEAIAHRDALIVRRASHDAPLGELGLAAGVQLGRFRFHARDEDVVSLWSAKLPVSRTLTVRVWKHGDRMIPAGGDARRVKGLLRDAGVDAASRSSWPVVLVDDEIVWIPGVRRSAAVSARSGRPVVTYHCERLR